MWMVNRVALGISTAMSWDDLGAEASRTEAQTQTRKPTTSSGQRKGLTLRLNPSAWRQLRQLAFDDERSAHDLLIDYYEKRGKPRIA